MVTSSPTHRYNISLSTKNSLLTLKGGRQFRCQSKLYPAGKRPNEVFRCHLQPSPSVVIPSLSSWGRTVVWTWSMSHPSKAVTNPVCTGQSIGWHPVRYRATERLGRKLRARSRKFSRRRLHRIRRVGIFYQRNLGHHYNVSVYKRDRWINLYLPIRKRHIQACQRRDVEGRKQREAKA